MLDVGVDRLLERKLLRAILVNRQHVDGERSLHRCEFEELRHHHLRAGVALQFDLDASVLRGKVAHAGDAGEDLFVDELRDTFLQNGAVHAVWHAADDDVGAASGIFLDLHFTAHPHRATAGAEVFFDATDAADLAGHRKVGALHVLHQLGQRDLGVVDLRADRLDHFAEVVRREIGGHAHRDTGAAVDEEVRERRRQDGWLRLRTVIVRNHVDRVLVEVVHHRETERMKPRFGVTHGGGRVAFHRSEVTLAVDQHFAHRPWLTHVDERGVDRHVTVRVEVTHRFTDDLGALDVGLARADAELAHRIENAALGRLETIPHIGKGAGNNHRHRVFQEGLG